LVNTTVASDAFEIESLKLASANGASAAMKKSADRIITVLEISTAKLKALFGTRRQA
jgi:putative membrane protein